MSYFFKTQIYKFFLSSVGKKQLFWFLGLAFVSAKTKCAVCAMAFYNEAQRNEDLRSSKNSERSEENFWNFANPLLGDVPKRSEGTSPTKDVILVPLSGSAEAKRRHFHSTSKLPAVVGRKPLP
ncbi:hypothetical protein [Thermoflexibacter ruber]|uniref:hypothetical protein n=1 Tax=Thermoflexibacter ruber TaxID=1003 RepID=UPI0015A62CA5|nr:hypothetical protein [Thermoflexibacter ruber]